MRGVLCTLLLLSGLELARSLECYVCLTPTPSDECMTRRNCSEKQTWCVSTVYGPTTSGFPFRGSRYVIRNCAEECQPSNPNYLGVINPVFCCQEDRCNTVSERNTGSTASGSHITYWVLASITGWLLMTL